LVLLLVVVLALASTAPWWGLLIDDAYISFRYAYHLAHGHGLVFQPGERVEGFTNLSWTLLAALGIKLGISPLWLMPLAGTAALVTLMLAVARAGARLAIAEGRPSPWAGIGAAGLCVAHASFGFYAATGLETIAFSLVVTLAAVAVAEGRVIAFAVFAALAILTRPEAGLLVVVGAALLANSSLRAGAKSARAPLAALAILAVVGVSFVAWKKSYFGEWLPNTFRAKRPDGHLGFDYLATRAPIVVSWLLGASVMALRHKSQAHAKLLLMGGLQVIAAGVAGGDWMPGDRMLVPWLPLLALAMDGAFLRAAERGARSAALAALSLCVLGGGYASWRAGQEQWVFAQLQESYVAPSDRAYRMMVAAGIRSVGTVNIGRVGWLYPDLRILDLGGLTDATIGASPGAWWSKEWPSSYVHDRAPDAFVFTSLGPIVQSSGASHITTSYLSEDRVLSMPWFWDEYRYVASQPLGNNFYLHVFRRKDPRAGAAPS
jgi:hypothetical protein